MEGQGENDPLAATGEEDSPFDYCHLNSIEKDANGDYLVSWRVKGGRCWKTMLTANFLTPLALGSNSRQSCQNLWRRWQRHLANGW